VNEERYELDIKIHKTLTTAHCNNIIALVLETTIGKKHSLIHTALLYNLDFLPVSNAVATEFSVKAFIY